MCHDRGTFGDVYFPHVLRHTFAPPTAVDADPKTRRARLSYRRAEEMFRAATGGAVLRSGPILTCRALTSLRSKPRASSTYQTGFQ